MFQTFTGNSRRPRQVNLSGRNTNPFASSQQKATPQGSPAAVLQAQQERRARQHERERLRAAETIQRRWRGYSTRRAATAEFRRTWDLQETGLERDKPGSPGNGPKVDALSHLKLLLRFANPRKDESDIRRISNYAAFFSRKSKDYTADQVSYEWKIPLGKLTELVVLVLDKADLDEIKGQNSQSHTAQDLLLFLHRSIVLLPDHSLAFFRSYYSSLARILFQGIRLPRFPNLLLELLKAPLRVSGDTLDNAHGGLVLGLLTVPQLHEHIDLNHLAVAVNGASLSLALRSLLEEQDISSSVPRGRLPWLLAYYIRLYRSSAKTTSPSHTTEMKHIAIVSNLLSILADDIRAKQDINNTVSAALPDYAYKEITTLIDQQTITSLLTHTEIVRTVQTDLLSHSDDASVLASYVLTLLQVFPRRSDEIRMWLYLGSSPSRTKDNRNLERLPAIKFFSRAVFQTRVFENIFSASRGAIGLVGQSQRRQLSPLERSRLEQEWRVVLLFLELYTFVLKIMDDEEFMSGSEIVDEYASWTRQSALKLSEVKDLVVFLKNFAFAMYWYTSEISGNTAVLEHKGLKSYFSSASEISPPATSQTRTGPSDELVVPGIQSSAVSYLKGTVTGLLRMLYERDSRRRFLPKGHWLMQEFDMSGFIGAVLEEQTHRNEHREDEDEDDDLMDEDYSSYYREVSLIGTSRAQAVRRMEQLKRQQQKAARKKRLEDTVPRLNILENMPFFIPFETRVQIFREFVRTDQEVRRNGFLDPDQWRMSIMQRGFAGGAALASTDQFIQKHSAKVRRDRVFEDAYEQFYDLGEGLKEPIQITFVDQFDTPEAGIDGGGVTKEFLTSVTNEAFMPGGHLDLFVENDEHLLYPNPEQVEKQKSFIKQAGFKEGTPEWNETIRELLRQYEFLGRVVGKCLYEGILVDIHFAPFFLVKWALTGGAGSATNESGYRATINDLRDLDEGLYQGLLKLKNYPGNVEDFALDFTITDTISFRDGSETQTITRELCENGANTPVTNENRLVYISYVARHRLKVQPRLQTSAFLKGLGTMIQPSWLSMFNQSELQTLIGGEFSEIDVNDLRRNTLYGGVYQIGDDGKEHPTVRLFWRVMEELSDEDRRKLLKYVTSTPRAPLLGFNQLNPQFSIRDSGSDQDRLPSTSTCVNLLKLPIYTNKQLLRDKLVYAINAGAGFNLS